MLISYLFIFESKYNSPWFKSLPWRWANYPLQLCKQYQIWKLILILPSLKNPNILRIENSFGKDFASVVEKATNINILQSVLGEVSRQSSIEEKKVRYYHFTINTHSDALPYYRRYFSKNNSIAQCHFPTAKYHIQSENEEYLKETRVGSIINKDIINNTTAANIKTYKK